ncbi:hypothetical protein LV779_34245 [Streptomyces thinghirensis]|nr:hypothetical protein [Streptomyces thinghirensis]
MTVPLQARGIPLGVAHFWRAEGSAPFDQEDLTFAEELTARAAVAIDNASPFHPRAHDGGNPSAEPPAACPAQSECR